MLTLFPADCCALVVEDEPVQALGLACMLAGFGCQVLGPATSAREALQLLRGRRPSFALCDARLPASSLVPLAEALAHLEVPFAMLATSREDMVRTQLPVLR
jgi:CheY-like chemotaxis protein